MLLTDKFIKEFNCFGFENTILWHFVVHDTLWFIDITSQQPLLHSKSFIYMLEMPMMKYLQAALQVVSSQSESHV